MNNKFPRLGAFAIAAALQVGVAGLAFAQGGPPPSGATGQPPGYAGGAPGQMVEPTQSSATTPGTELPVLYVTSVEVMRTSTEPKLDIVRVTGLTGSQGWSAPQLVPTFVGKPLDGVLDLQFIATSRSRLSRPKALCLSARFFHWRRATYSKGCACVPPRMQSKSSRCRG